MTSGFLWNKKAEKESFRAFSRSLEKKQIWIWKFGLFVISFDSEASNSQFLITVTHFPHSWQLNNLLVSSLWEASKPFSPRKLFPLVWNSESEQFAVLVLVLVHSTRLDEILLHQHHPRDILSGEPLAPLHVHADDKLIWIVNIFPRRSTDHCSVPEREGEWKKLLTNPAQSWHFHQRHGNFFSLSRFAVHPSLRLQTRLIGCDDRARFF